MIRYPTILLVFILTGCANQTPDALKKRDDNVKRCETQCAPRKIWHNRLTNWSMSVCYCQDE